MAVSIHMDQSLYFTRVDTILDSFIGSQPLLYLVIRSGLIYYTTLQQYSSMVYTVYYTVLYYTSLQ